MTACAVTVTGCVPSNLRPTPAETVPHDAPFGGQTKHEFLNNLRSIQGIDVVGVDGGDPPNIKGNTGYDFRFRLTPGYEIDDAPGFVSYVIESAWAVRDGYLPNAQISISVTAGSGSTFDIAEAATDAGWTENDSSPPSSTGYSRVSIDMRDGSPARERLGPWPGPVPTLPPDLTARIPSSESTPHG